MNGLLYVLAVKKKNEYIRDQNLSFEIAEPFSYVMYLYIIINNMIRKSIRILEWVYTSQMYLQLSPGYWNIFR